MERMLLQLTVCLLTCFLVWSDDTSVGQNEPSTCRYSSRCYNPFWCEAVLSTRECSNRSRCCADVYYKVECLKDLLDERTKTLIFSSELIDNIIKNATESLSQHDELRKKVDSLKTLCNENEKATSSEIKFLKTDIDSAYSELHSIYQSSSDVKNRYTFVSEEIEVLKQRNAETDNALKKLVNEEKFTSDHLDSLKTTISKQFGNTQTQISDITGMLDRNISSYESKWLDLFSNETETVNQTLNSLDLRLEDAVKNLNTSVEMLNDTLENVKVNFTQDLKETSTEIKANIKSIQTKTESLENSFETYKSKIEDDIEIKANNAYDRLLKTITEKSNELSGKINELTGKIDSKTSLISTELEQLKSHVSQSIQDLENRIKNDAETLRSKVNRDIANLDTRLHEISTNSRTAIEDTNKKLSKLGENMEEHKRENAVNIEELKNTLTDLVQENVSEVQTKVDELLQKVHKDIEQFKNEIGQLIKHEVEQLSKQANEVNQTLAEQQGTVEIILRNIFNKEMFIIAFIILVVLLAINCGSVYVLWKRTSPSQPVVRRDTTNSVPSASSSGEEPHSPVKGKHDILKKIPEGTELETGVCIISFDESRTTTHRRILDSANIPHCRVQVHVVRRHEHIPELPRCKVYLMCTEFSERHVIIEEPGKGLGDLHRTTYDAVVKLGGCLIILYTRDPGSRNLEDQVRYNKNIYCVANQPELSNLNKDGRFFSVYDNLNNYQKSELRKKITEYMI